MLLKHENGDCRILCRMLGIYSKDKLNAKIDENHKYYNLKRNQFTMFNNVSIQNFVFLTHWLRYKNLDLAALGTESVQVLQFIGAKFGMDGLSKQIYENIQETKNHPKPILLPQDDVYDLYRWISVPRIHNRYNDAQTLIDNGWSQTCVEDSLQTAWFRKAKETGDL